ncbi:membrane protein [Streptomyces lucensis JCM 4490]|uniref:Membrane protein n=1 Tax=Streptomyces lucensis JCM 4490 TaxID=1306176 RepID=A0A918JD51_9ACTN|nr:CAP domain-containing protein [Streptomyces lucensis]GGW75448.1 membrane protein [Streptomyces lucensis JCM 4490]
MGRHRRSAAGRAAEGRATGGTHTYDSAQGNDDPSNPSAGRRTPMGIAPYLNPQAYAETNAKAHAYLFEADDDTPAAGGGFTPAGGPSPGHRHRKRAGRPVRAGLLGVSAAVALGTVAVATGVVPGLEDYGLGGGTKTTGADHVEPVGVPSNTASEQGGTSGSADSGDGSTAGSRGAGGNTGQSRSPRPSASPSTSAPASPSPSKPASSEPAPSKTATREPAPRATPSKPKSTPSRKTPKAPSAPSAPGPVSKESAVEAEVLKLVNEERAKAGCSALSANSSLARLAGSFSDDMAARGFFDHTDPDGATPWDRAAKAGITDLGGENIARGQTDAAAVMEAWMNSPGHRANILNCDFKTLGVGVHLGPGGPWWTQDFGY